MQANPQSFWHRNPFDLSFVLHLPMLRFVTFPEPACSHGVNMQLPENTSMASADVRLEIALKFQPNSPVAHLVRLYCLA